MKLNISPVRKLCSLLAVMLAAGLSLHAQAPETIHYRTMPDIIYTHGISGPLKADAYIPSGAGPFPGILFIHGGAWSSGNRSQMLRLIKDLASHGYVGFTIDYDLVPVRYPAALNESLEAVRYFRQHSKEFNLDSTRIAVAGSSAGGELAALTGLTQDAHVQAAVILNGVLDLMAMGDQNDMVTKYLGGPCLSLLAACRSASPVSQVHADAPPFFVGHGTADTTVPYAQAENFVSRLRAAGVQVKAFTATDGPHTYWNKELFYSKNLEEIESFLAQALRKTAQP